MWVRAKAGAVDDVVQPRLEDLQQGLTGPAGPGGLGALAADLLLHDAVAMSPPTRSVFRRWDFLVTGPE
jgi:hypothetical protein